MRITVRQLRVVPLERLPDEATGAAALAPASLRVCPGDLFLEIVSDFDGHLPRGVRDPIPDAVYVLHAFQKKSHSGGQVPKRDREIIEKRLAAVVAEQRARKRAG